MKSALVLLAFAQAALISAAKSTACNNDNCARAVTGTIKYSSAIQSDHRADCSSFMRTTVTPATFTTTVTITTTPNLPKRDGNGMLVVRDVTQTPTAVPSYASACSGTARYSSACSCAGITAMTTTAATPTATATTTVAFTCPPGKTMCASGVCKDLAIDPANCGSCGHACAAGSACANGVCTSPACVGSTCNSLSACGDNCFCFEIAEGAGSCGPGTSCEPLPDCNTSLDCAVGTVCATGTCCGRNVCLGPQGCDSGVGISQRSLFGRAAGDGLWTFGIPPPHR